MNRRTMTIYLWHMPVLLAMAGISAALSLASGIVLPEPSGFSWWVSRPLWLAVALALTAAISVALARLEVRRAPLPTDSCARTVVAAVIGVASIVLLLVAGTTILTAAVAVAAMVLSLRLARRSHQTSGGEGVTDLVRVA